MKIVASSLPKSGSKSLINDLGKHFWNCIYIEAKVDRGLGNLSTSKLARVLFKTIPMSRILYGHFPFCSTLETTVRRADLVAIGLRPLSQLVFSYKRHIERTGYSPLDLRVGGYPDISLGWDKKSEIEKIEFLLDWIVPYSAKFLLSWIWVSKNLSQKVEFVLYEDVTSKAYSGPLIKKLTISRPKTQLGLHIGRRSTNIVKSGPVVEVDQITSSHVNELIQLRRKFYVADFAGDEALFDYLFN